MTTKPLRYVCKALNAALYIPEEFITDLASVPRLPLTWYIAGGRAIRPALPHDFAYQFGYFLLAGGGKLAVARDQADTVIHEACLADPISGADDRITAGLIYSAVRVGGRGVWNERPARTPTLNPEWSAAWGVESP